MAFTYQDKLQIHDKAGGQCQCVRQNCSHFGRCTKIYTPTLNAVAKLLRGVEEYIFPGFEFHHIQSQAAGGANTPANGAFLCTYCHQQTNSYGTNLTRNL